MPLSSMAPRSAPSALHSCVDAAAALWAAVDAPLTAPLPAGLDAHLAVCEGCATEFALQRAQRRRLSRVGGPQAAPPRLRAQVLARLRGTAVERHLAQERR